MQQGEQMPRGSLRMSGQILIHQDHHICGAFNSAISQSDIYRFGLHVGVQVSNGPSQQIIVATDNTHLNREHVELAIGGLIGADCDVVFLGCAPYSMVTHAIRRLNIPNALMMTPGEGSENDIGFRLMLNKQPTPSFILKNMLEESRNESFGGIKGEGRRTQVDLNQGYLRWLMHGARPSKGNLSVLWDVGHGATTDIITSIASLLPGRHVVINQASDNNEANDNDQDPHPTFGENLKGNVTAGGFDLGIAFNSDGTRLIMTDELGNRIYEAQRLDLLAKRSKRQPVAGNGLLASRRKARTDILKHTIKVIRVLTENGKPISTYVRGLPSNDMHLGKGSVTTAPYPQERDAV